MGFDCTAYSGIKQMKPGKGFDAAGNFMFSDGTFQAVVNPHFPSQGSDLVDGAGYTYKKSEYCWSSGWAGYNGWREVLAQVAGHPLGPIERYGKVDLCHAASVWNNPEKPGPFVELINFSDCEGCIGPAACAKLAKDFADFQAKADAHPSESFRKGYAKWRKGFELAADNGCIRFH
jgi:hypothetical protein